MVFDTRRVGGEPFGASETHCHNIFQSSYQCARHAVLLAWCLNSSMVFSVSLSVCGHGGVPDVKLEQIEER